MICDAFFCDSFLFISTFGTGNGRFYTNIA